MDESHIEFINIHNLNIPRMLYPLRSLLIAVLSSISLVALADDTTNTFHISTWLTTSPLASPEPLYLDSAGRQDRSRYLDTDADYLNWRPETNKTLDWFPGETAEWTVQSGESLSWPSNYVTPHVAFAASYITSSRWQEIPVSIHSSGAVAVWLDGKLIEKQTAAKDGVFEINPTLTLHRGKHLLLIKTVSNPDTGAWTLRASASPDSANNGTLSFDSDPRRPLAEFKYAALMQDLSSPVISPDGKLAAILHSQRNEEYKKETWLEVYDVKSGSLLHTIRPAKIVSKPFFFPKSNKIGFVISSDDGAAIWTYDLETNEQRPVVEKIKGLERFVCSPDEKFIYYTADEEESEAEKKSAYRHLDQLEDKVTDWTDKRRLYVASIENGAIHPLSELGTHAFDHFALSREGDKIAFVRYVSKTGRPYYDSEIWVYDIASRSADKIISLAMTEPPANLTWLPGGSQLAYSAASFETTPADTVFHNVNHHLLYVLDIPSRRITKLNEGQTFSVAEQGGGSRIYYNPRDKHLYLLGVLGGQIRIFKANPSKPGQIQMVNLSWPVIDDYQLSLDGSTIILTATSPNHPFAVFTVDAKSGMESKLLDPNAKVFDQFRLATFEKWNFSNSDGYTIEGWLYFPPDFNPNHSWPTIVYYYGGVSPRDERFTFTYHWLAANGYVVYVLNPVGSVGYGQEFADKHSNDWGTLATRDVIEGTKMLIASKPYVDETRLGAFGGSYGGFITLDLLTKTDQFAVAVDMYGISNIASYFGGGTWGHLYGDLALPGSYPWSHRDIFVEKSPLYHADKIKTPLLILHGEADNNVPPVESDQMFAALKILGRDVEYVRFKEETHNINVKYDNLIAHREMMLEWFDKYLKDELEAWEARWKQEK